MLTYCFKCKRNTKNIDVKMLKTENGRLMLSSECALCGSKKSRFMKEQEAEGLYVLIMSGTCFRVNPHSIVA